MAAKWVVKIRFQNRAETILCPSGANLLELLHQHGHSVYSPCGGKGRCGKCLARVRGRAGTVTASERKHLTQAQIDDGIRLACQIQVTGDLEVDLSPAQQLVILADGLAGDFQPDPHIRQEEIRLEQPRIDRQHDCWSRLQQQLGCREAAPEALRRLGELSRKLDLLVTYKGDKVIAVDDGEAGKEKAVPYSIAVDIGTTTVVLYLINLANGVQVGAYAFANPQSRYGADVISRIDYTINHAEGCRELKQTLLKALNEGIRHLASRHGIDPARIYHAAVAGNTVMLHMLLGVSAAGIANAPYVPVFTDGLELSGRELGLEIYPEGLVELLPSVSGYVGADIIADLLAADFESEKWRLLVDIGTNGEIVLGNRER
ncbi:MAG TPA: 2Fe-2S iron-sulfur cluster-binding protein, partial [Limnochordia bacterium]|nr:2Fe-2S iron-sulfur cluster-binding protein [Limnochordia bacterium]